jgi:hypothetical protein
MSANRRTCEIEGCDRPTAYPRSGLCHACYQGLYYWDKKNIPAKMRRQKNLRIYANRLAILVPKPSSKRTKK